MWTSEQIQKALEAKIEGSKVAVDDMTGTSDHFQVTVVSDSFEGMSPIQRHRKVYDALGSDVGGAIHALAIKTYTNKQWALLREGSGGLS